MLRFVTAPAQQRTPLARLRCVRGTQIRARGNAGTAEIRAGTIACSRD
jgi:hypothetical protein